MKKIIMIAILVIFAVIVFISLISGSSSLLGTAKNAADKTSNLYKVNTDISSPWDN